MAQLLTPILWIALSMQFIFASEPKWEFKEFKGGGNIQKMNALDVSSAVVAGYNYVFKLSNNKGATFQDVPLLLSDYNFMDLSFVGHVAYVASSKTVAISTPAGSYDNIYTPGVILKTVDAGLSWQVISSLSVGEGDDSNTNPNSAESGCSGLDFTAVETINDSVALVAARWDDYNSGSKQGKSGIFKTINGGLSWKHVLDTDGKYVRFIKHFNGKLYIGGQNFFMISGDTAQTFTNRFDELVSANADDDAIYLYNISFSGTDEVIITSSADGVYVAAGAEAVFTKLPEIKNAFNFLKLNDSTLVVVGSSSNSKLSTNGGLTWKAYSPGVTAYNCYGPWNDTVYYLAKSKFFKVSVDDVAHGLAYFEGVPINGVSNLTNMAVANNDVPFISGNGAVLLKKKLATNNWEKEELTIKSDALNIDFMGLSNAPDKSGLLSSLAIKYVDFPSSTKLNDLYYPGVIYRTLDGWNSWDVLNTKAIGEAYANDVTKNPAAPGCKNFDPREVLCIDVDNYVVYAKWADSTSVTGVDTYHARIFKTKDAGKNWQVCSDDLGSGVITTLVSDDNILYAGGSNQLLRSSDNGDTFQSIYATLATGTDGKLYVSDISVNKNHSLLFATTTDGLFLSNPTVTAFTKFDGVSGSNTAMYLDDETILNLGTASRSLLSEDGGLTWNNCKAGSTIYKLGPVWNDTVYALAKSGVFVAHLNEFGVNTGIIPTFASVNNSIEMYYASGSFYVKSKNSSVEKCWIYNMQGECVYTLLPNSESFVLSDKSFTSGIYIIVAQNSKERVVQKVMVR